jgi:hypothetical protein
MGNRLRGASTLVFSSWAERDGGEAETFGVCETLRRFLAGLEFGAEEPDEGDRTLEGFFFWEVTKESSRRYLIGLG